MNSPGTDAVRLASRAGFVWGTFTIVLGMLAVSAPLYSGLAVGTLVAFVLIAAGIAQTIFAFKAGSFGEGLFTFLFGAFGMLAGAFLLARPLIGLASITMILATYFFVDGVCGVLTAWRVRPVRGWGWMLFSAIASVVLGVMILRHWPMSGVWAVGTLVGVRLLFSGWSMIALGGLGKALADEADLASR